MFTNPKENRTHSSFILIEQFRRKGYRCEEVKEEKATIFIITHEKKGIDSFTQVVTETYKDLLKAN
jgi:hypothetical protein